jgi:FAD/FMN-containing dehydrogenase
VIGKTVPFGKTDGMPLTPPAPSAIEHLTALAGPNGAILDEREMQPYLHEWRDRYVGRSPLILRPNTVERVSAILAYANRERIAVVPQGGNTGLVGGQIPFEGGTEIVLSLSRLNRIRHVDAAGNAITVDAGVTLKAVQDAASAVNRLFPLSLGAEGSCQIGGNLGTNAGGVHVLRYGNTRELTLGLEAVFADGRVWNGLKALRKDNTGYDLKDLLIGSEGTLAVITGATLKLFPRPAEVATVFAGFPSLEAAGSFFNLAFERCGPLLTAFEIIPRILLDFMLRHVPDTRDPLEAPHAWCVLFEVSSPLEDGLAEQVALAVLERGMEASLLADATLAATESQAQAFWLMRETMSEVQKREGGSIKNDVSVPVSAIPSFIAEANDAVEALVPGARPVPFGHYGDGNIHYNISQPAGGDTRSFLNRWDEVADAVNAIVLKYGGSISAEHGIGRMKAHQLEAIKSPLELDIMRRIKTALDPNGILNPGKVLVAEPS